ncbi:MAG: type IV toxin-antitoxin system AbiEi family antitoxin [Kiritimatiellia bacterium]
MRHTQSGKHGVSRMAGAVLAGLMSIAANGATGAEYKWVLRVCPFEPAHDNRSAVIIIRANGASGFCCHHDSCRGKNWKALRAMYEPKSDKPARREIPTVEPAEGDEELIAQYGPPILLNAGEVPTDINQMFVAARHKRDNLILFEPTLAMFYCYDEPTGLWKPKTESRVVVELGDSLPVLLDAYGAAPLLRKRSETFMEQVLRFLKGMVEEPDAFQRRDPGTFPARTGAVLMFLVDNPNPAEQDTENEARPGCGQVPRRRYRQWIGLADVHDIWHVHAHVNKDKVMNMDNHSESEVSRVLAASLESLLDQVGWLRSWKMAKEARTGKGRVIDLLITVPLPKGGNALLCVACKKELRPSEFRQFADQFQQSLPTTKNVVPVLGLPSVSPRMAELCSEHGWGWFDLVGNCRLDIPGLLHLQHTGIPPNHRRPKPLANLSTPEAGRVIRALLQPDTQALYWTQRKMQTQCQPNVSLGLVNKVVRYLRDEAFIEEITAGGFRVRDPQKLLYAWRDAYRFDRYVRRNYFTLLQGGKLRDALASFGAHAGGVAAYAAFSAADFQAPHVRQAKTWLYVRGSEIPGFEAATEAKQVESGENLVVLIPEDDGVFYQADAGGQNGRRLACTNAVQTYVDLCHCGGRGAEAAEALLEQFLKPKWNETTLKKVVFQLTSAPGGKVSVAGSFNNWDPEKNPMKETAGSGLYKATIAVPPGKHEYKFVVDGEWQMDPNCTEWVPNCHGTLNSVLCVQA